MPDGTRPYVIGFLKTESDSPKKDAAQTWCSVILFLSVLPQIGTHSNATPWSMAHKKKKKYRYFNDISISIV